MNAQSLSRWALGAWLAAGWTGCTTPSFTPPVQPADPEVARLAASARAAMEEDAPDKAAVLYREALVRAEALDDQIISAHVSFNLAVVLFRTRDLPGARTAVTRAEALAEKIGTGRVAPTLLRARIAWMEHKPDEAATACDTAEAGNPDALERADLALIRAEIARERGEDAAMDRFAVEAKSRMPRSAPPAWKARLHGLLGEGELRAKRPTAAAEEFQLEAEAARAARYAPGVSAALLREAAARSEAGDTVPAAECYLRAARSLQAQQRHASAQSAAAAGLALPRAGIPAEWLDALNRIGPQTGDAP